MSYNEKSFKTLTTTIEQFRTQATIKPALDYLVNNAKVYLDRQIAAGPKGSEKKLWEQSSNLVVSFIEGASTGDVKIKDLKTLSAELRMAEKAHEERVFRMSERKQAEQAANLVHEGDLDAYPVTDPKFDPGEGAKAVYEKYEQYQHKTDIDTRKAFVAVRSPIVVISNGIPDLMKLKKTGLCDDLLFGYPVLKNQVLVGFNTAYLTQHTKNWSKYQKDVKNNIPTSVSLDVDWETVSDELARDLKERTGKSYVMLGKAHRHGKLQWVWMAESGELRRLNGTTGPSTFSVDDWTLPFETEMRRVKPNRRMK